MVAGVRKQRSGYLRWLVFAVAFFSRAPFARAFECETRTERPPEEIVVPLGDDESGRLAQAIKLQQGESVCITGTVDPWGMMIDLRVVPSAQGVSTPVVELRLERGDQDRLLVRHSGQNWLEYLGYAVRTQQNRAFRMSASPVGPGAANVETWTSGVDELWLAGLTFGSNPAHRAQRRRGRNPKVLNASVTFGFWGGERGIDFASLNGVLTRDGFAPLPYSRVMGGLDLDFTIGRVRGGVALGAGGSTVQHGESGAELSTWLSEIGFTLGYDFARYEQLHAFLSTGILVEDFYVERAPGLTAFPDVKPWEGDRIAFSAFSAPIEIGSDYFIPLGRASSNEFWIFQLGTRLGWIEQLGDGEWSTDEGPASRELTGGPPLDLSGWRGRIVLGIGVQNGW
jgi:hypothetical protein